MTRIYKKSESNNNIVFAVMTVIVFLINKKNS